MSIDQSDLCPACGSKRQIVAGGVCAKCKGNFKTQHAKKLDVTWHESDFRIYSAPAQSIPELAIEDASETNLEREAQLKAQQFFKNSIRQLVQFNGNLNLALYAYCLARGWSDLIGCETAVEVAVKLFGNPKKKAAVTRLVKKFQDCENIEPMPGQRKNDGRLKMTKAREKQLK